MTEVATSHYILHNQVDALKIDQIFFESKVLQSLMAGGVHVYPEFQILGQDVFFALYKIYLQTTPEQTNDRHRLLLDPLLESQALTKLRRRSAGSSANSYIALKHVLDFFLEQVRGRDILEQTNQLADDALKAITQTLSPTELETITSILSMQNKRLNRPNLTQLLQDIYDYCQSDSAPDDTSDPNSQGDTSTEDPSPSMFEEALHQLEDSYREEPGDQALNQRLDESEAIDQTFKGGLRTEMDNRFSSFLKDRILVRGESLGPDLFTSPLDDTEETQEKRVQSGGEGEIIQTESFQLTPEQEQSLKDWKRKGEHQPPDDLRDLDQLDYLSNPAAQISWDQVLEEISLGVDMFEDHIAELGIRKDTLENESFDRVIDLYRRVTQPKFRQMIDRIGRNKRYARKVQYQKRSAQAKPIDKVDRSNRIDDMIDDEYIQLAIETFETDFYDRYLSDALLTTKMIHQSDKRRGPIIVCYDGSGSMSGLKIQDTRMHILSLLEIAKIQQRHLVIIQFASKAEPLFIKELNPLEISAGDVYDILDTFLSGGTDFELPLQKALEYIRRDRHRKSDILFFTDGLASISEKFKQLFLKQKESYQFKLFTVIMHSLTYEDYGDIGQISDEILTIEEKDIGQNYDLSYQRIYQAI